MLDVETLGAALKLVKEGGGGGGEGAAIIDDSKILTSTTWSSQKIVNTLCPPFTASGSVVQCTPVENSPLDVQVEITPTQEGTGDPSPENVRPIVGWDAVNVWRAGKNLLDWSKVSASVYSHYGLSFEKKENSIRVFGTSTQSGDLSFNIATTTQSELYGKNFIFSWFTKELSEVYVYGLRTVPENSIAIQMNLQEGQVYDFTIQIALGVQKLNAYEPYQGNTYTVQLGQTVYGGTLDVGMGLVINSLKLLSNQSVLSGVNTPAESQNWVSCFWSNNITDGDRRNNTQIFCSVLPCYEWNGLLQADVFAWYSVNSFGIAGTLTAFNLTGGEDNDSILAAVNSYISSLPSFTFLYELNSPPSIQLSPQQILALSGTNTLFADAGSVTVSGLSDTVETFNALENRIAALEEAAISG